MNAHARSVGRFTSVLVIVGLVAACTGAGPTAEEPGPTANPTSVRTVPPPTTTSPPPTEGTCATMTPIKLQLQWVVQSQFAGYFAAVDEGYYAAECLEVTILEGAVDIVPQQVLASGQADFAISWVPKALVSREEGADIVNIGQVFQRSGTLMVSYGYADITEPADWAGKKVGTWGFGNEFELLAAMTQAGLDPATDLELVQQPFDMSLFLNREIDAAQAMTYNEYAQVLEAVNPRTGALFQPDELSIIDFNEIGTAMLQDAVWANAEWLAAEGNEDIALRFLRASFRGWIYCRDNFQACVALVLSHGPALGNSHMAWMLNEINKLIWPAPAGIGVMDQALWDQTVDVATSQAVLSAPPDAGAFRTDLAAQAVADIESVGFDATGAGYTPVKVKLVVGGD